MTTYSFPAVVPNRSSWKLESNTAIHISPLSGAIQTLDRGGEHWRVNLSFQNLTAANKAILKGFLVRLNGQQHRFTLHDHSLVQRGSLGGSATVNGAGQTGTSINLSGASGSPWIAAGDMFTIESRLKMCTVDSTGSTVSFMPRIVIAPASGAAVDVSDPTGVFMLASNSVDWSNAPGDLGTFSFDCIEDVTV